VKRTIVTGGAGFVGSHLCDALIGQGAEVLCVDDLSTGSMRNIAHLVGRPGFRFLRHDVTQTLPTETSSDEIYNLACPASPQAYQRYPVQTAKTAFLGTMHLLELAQRTGARFFQASTSEVYGDPEVHPQPEEYLGRVNPIGQRACYVESKRCGESLCFDYHRQFGVTIKIARIFNVYGPRMDPQDGRVVSNFIVRALSNRHLTISGDGTQTRSFCYIDDLISGILALMRCLPGVTGPINLGNPQECSIRELAGHIARLTDIELKLAFAPRVPDDPSRRLPDISRAKALLGWEPRVTLDEGLRRTIAHFTPLFERSENFPVRELPIAGAARDMSLGIRMQSGSQSMPD
jgi:UDP-glucuronate decarboxylase